VRLLIFLFPLCCAALLGQTSPLDDLRILLEPMRAHASENLESRGATPGLTVVKHRLRDWIESRLTPLTRADEEVVLAFQLNQELRDAKLACDYHAATSVAPCPDQTLVGYIGEIAIHRDGGFLIVETAVGIQCGTDGSAYIYEWKNERWQRIWETEQNDYSEKRYLPQWLLAVLISPANYEEGADRKQHLVVTLGKNPWCSSNWQTVYYRVWLIQEGTPARLLLDENEWGYVAEPPRAAVWPDDILIEYAIGSVDGDVHSRRQIRHYVLKIGSLQRVDPFVLGPRDFVDHWLQGPSPEIAARTPATIRAAERNWERRFKGPYGFIQPTRHCTDRPDVWQVGVTEALKDSPLGYFLVRWRPPYEFSLVGISDHPLPGCTKADPNADAFRTLFPDTDHH
jgi:hypothetical protein